MPRPEIPDLVKAAQQAAKRLAHAVDAKARWSYSRSNGLERRPSAEESRLHEAMQEVLSQLCPVTLQLRHTVASIALRAGEVLRIPGIVRIRMVPPSQRFSSKLARERFPGLAAGHMIEMIDGRFSWRNVPSLGSPEWTKLRSEVECLERQQRDLQAAMLNDPYRMRDERERTDDLARLHEDYLDLKQQEARLSFYGEDLKAEMIQLIEEFETISGVCRFYRSPMRVLNATSFREAHKPEAAQCYSDRAAHIQWRIYASRSPYRRSMN